MKTGALNLKSQSHGLQQWMSDGALFTEHAISRFFFTWQEARALACWVGRGSGKHLEIVPYRY